MLKEKKFEKNDILTLKLVTSEEVIAQFESEVEDQVVVKKSSIVAANPQGGLGLVPWMMSAMPDKIGINKSDIVVITETAKPIADKFIEATTNIQLAK